MSSRKKKSLSKEPDLWTAAGAGDADLIKALLSSEPPVNVNWVGPEKGDTPLHRACRFGHLHIVEILLRHPEVDVNAKNTGWATSFFLACQEGQLNVVTLLLADDRSHINGPDIDGSSPFFMACLNVSLQVASLLLTDMRIDINQPEGSQCTPLWAVSQNGLLQFVRLLLVSGREVNTKTKSIAGSAGWNNKTAAEQARVQGMKMNLMRSTPEESKMAL